MPDLLDPPTDSEEASRTAVPDSQRLSRTRLVLRRFWRPVGARVGVAGLLVVALLAIVGPGLAQWDYAEVDTTAFLTGPSSEHWFGTTQGGRDVFALTMQGLRLSLVIGFATATLQVLLSAITGAVAAYFGNAVDTVMLWIIDLLLVIPSFLLIAVVSQQFAGAQSSLTTFILVLAGFGWMLPARVVRAMTRSIVGREYVTAARFMSVPSWVIIVKHVIPNISSFLIVNFTLGVVNAIIAETSLSYFGFGVQSPQTSLGTLLAEGAPRATTSSWIFLAPAGMLVLILLSVNFVGDSLRDAVDPASRSGGEI